MNKITRLGTIHTHLSVRLINYTHQLLRAGSLNLSLDTVERYTQCVGEGYVLQAEINDHRLSLHAIEAACKHGLAGTSTEGYPEYGYEFTEDAAEPELPYDPYTDILGYLAGGANISCMTLSPALLRYIELLPEVAAIRAERNIEAKEGRLLHVGDNGDTRPMTKSELRRLGNRAVLDAVEESLFATTYAQDMLRIQELAHARGDLHQILDLLA